MRVRTLLVPYYLWNFIWFPILFFFNWIGWRYFGAERVVDGSVMCVLRCLGLSIIGPPALVPTWYLRALFVAVSIISCLDYILNCVSRRSSWIVAIFFLDYELDK